MPKPIGYLFVVIVCCPFFAHGQLTVSGVTRDSATFAPIPFVSIQIAGKVVTTGQDGAFHFNCHIGDTSVFTHMGYKKKIMLHFRDEINLTILLTESPLFLESVTIMDGYKPEGHAKWRDYIILPKLLENPSGKDQYGMIQTFGVGGRIPGPISYFTKYERDRRNYKKKMEDQAATQIFREVISSEKTKNDLLQLFSITEAEYFKKIESFNIRHPDAAYLKTRQEVMDMLIGFFALKEN